MKFVKPTKKSIDERKKRFELIVKQNEANRQEESQNNSKKKPMSEELTNIME